MMRALVLGAPLSLLALCAVLGLCALLRRRKRLRRSHEYLGHSADASSGAPSPSDREAGGASRGPLRMIRLADATGRGPARARAVVREGQLGVLGPKRRRAAPSPRGGARGGVAPSTEWGQELSGLSAPAAEGPSAASAAAVAGTARRGGVSPPRVSGAPGAPKTSPPRARQGADQQRARRPSGGGRRLSGGFQRLAEQTMVSEHL